MGHQRTPDYRRHTAHSTFSRSHDELAHEQLKNDDRDRDQLDQAERQGQTEWVRFGEEVRQDELQCDRCPTQDRRGRQSLQPDRDTCPFARLVTHDPAPDDRDPFRIRLSRATSSIGLNGFVT